MGFNSAFKGLRSAEYPMRWMRMMMICCGMAVKRMVMLEVRVQNTKSRTVKMETVTLTGKGG